MIEVKAGQRWKRHLTGEVLHVENKVSPGYWQCTSGGRCAAHFLNQYGTLTYDPDEGEAPPVGSRWRRYFEAEELTVTGIVGVDGHPGVRLSDAQGPDDAWLFQGFRDGVNKIYTRLPDETTQPEPPGQLRERRMCHAPRCLRDAATLLGMTVPACPEHEDVSMGLRDMGVAIAAFAKRAPVREPTRDELLEHWMSLRPDDLHEGGWRRVGVAQISGDTDMDDGLDTFGSVADVAEDIAYSIQRGSPWAFVRLYREEERRGKWWVS